MHQIEPPKHLGLAPLACLQSTQLLPLVVPPAPADQPCNHSDQQWVVFRRHCPSLQTISVPHPQVHHEHALRTPINMTPSGSTPLSNVVVMATVMLLHLVQWFLPDLSGMIGGILFTFYQGSNLDSNAKMWRLIADFMKEKNSLRRKTAAKDSSRKIYTATLTARSKAACGLNIKLPKEKIEDIDAGDVYNELAVVEYAEDIYKFYKEAEILADAMGLGKTVMSIALILARLGKGIPDNQELAEDMAITQHSRNRRIKGGTLLIVCPMALLGQWKDELEAHSKPDSISVCVHYGGDISNDPRVIAETDVVLTTYGLLTAAYKADGGK